MPVLNYDDAVSRKRAPALGERVEWFSVRASGESAHEPLGARQTLLVGRERLVVHERGGSRSFDETGDLPGEHNLAQPRRRRSSSARARRRAGAGGRGDPRARLTRRALRTREHRRACGIYDAYNASMSGTLATLDSFAREPAQRRLAVLGGMAELGDEAAAMHERVGAAAAQAGLDLLLLGGDFADELERGARGAGFPPERTLRYGSNAEAIALLRERARPGDLVLLKASRRYKLEEVREGLRAVYA